MTDQKNEVQRRLPRICQHCGAVLGWEKVYKNQWSHDQGQWCCGDRGAYLRAEELSQEEWDSWE